MSFSKFSIHFKSANVIYGESTRKVTVMVTYCYTPKNAARQVITSRLAKMEMELAKLDRAPFPPLFSVKAGASALTGANTTTARTLRTS